MYRLSDSQNCLQCLFNNYLLQCSILLLFYVACKYLKNTPYDQTFYLYQSSYLNLSFVAGFTAD